MLNKRWVFREKDDLLINTLHTSLKINKVLCELLVAREVHGYEEAKEYFRHDLSKLHDPLLMQDMDAAVMRLTTAIQKNESILLYGDYDVDGTTSVAMMKTFLNQFTTSVDYYIPDRYKEGYGLSVQGVDYAKHNNIKLMICMDCGITANDKVEIANTYGIDVIICDHHNPTDILPPAVAVLDPKRSDCNYPFKELSGCAVSFKLAQAYCTKQQLPLEKYLFHLLDLVAISVCCDIVPLKGENRLLAHFGIERINQKPRLGIAQLLKANSVEGKLEVSDIVFKVGPLINAAGRLDDAKDAVQLLIADAVEPALILAKQLVQQNKRRQELDKQISAEAIYSHQNGDATLDTPCVIEYNPKWHKGVIGIAASRVVEAFCKPAIIFTESNGKYVGSARSVKDYNIHQAISKCTDYIENFGGHHFAAGLTLHPNAFSAFKSSFIKVVSESIDPSHLVPEIEIDAIVEADDINSKFWNILKQMAPFGPGNRLPVFVTKNIQLHQLRLLNDLHIKATLITKKESIDVIGFNMKNEYPLVLDGNIDICYSIELNTWKNQEKLQLRLKDLRKAS